MDDMHRGLRSANVRIMQRLLNKAARRASAGGLPLVDDGRFGSHTEEAVRAFQREARMADTGICNAAMWRALGLVIEIRHDHVIRLGQPTDSSCWATAAAMILGNQSPSLSSEHLDEGGLRGTVEDHRAFADSLGWTMPMRTPGTAEMIGWLVRRPLWIRGGGNDWAHAVVFSGAFGDGTPDATMVRIHDPWPMGTGRIYGAFLDQLYSIAQDGGRVTMALEYILIPN